MATLGAGSRRALPRVPEGCAARLGPAGQGGGLEGRPQGAARPILLGRLAVLARPGQREERGAGRAAAPVGPSRPRARERARREEWRAGLRERRASGLAG